MANAISAAGEGLQKITCKTAFWIFAVGMVVMAFMPLPVFMDVFFRETSGLWPEIFSEETAYSIPTYMHGALDLVVLAFLVVTFAGFAWLGAQNDHISITFLLERFDERKRRLFEVFSTCVSVILLFTMAATIAVKVWERYARKEYTEDLELQLWIFTAFAAVSALVMSLGAIAAFLKTLGKSLEESPAFSCLIPILVALGLFAIPFLYKAGGFDLSMSVMGGLGMLLMVVMLFSGVPIGVSMGTVGLIGLLALYPNFNSAFSQLGIAPLTVSMKYDYTVIPLFILMGELAFHSRLSQDLFTAANVWLGRLPGGLAMAGVAGCAGFAAVCGDSMATAVTMGSVALPEMEKKKYDAGLGCASLAAGGTLGILIPPSMGFIFYAIITEVSVGKLFVAGILPGLLLTAAFLIVVAITAIRKPELAPRGEKTTAMMKFRSTIGIIPMVILIIFILGGILGGFFSPNEGGAMGAVGTFLYAVIRRTLSWRSFKASLHTTILVSGRLMLILVGVTVLGYFFALTQLPQLLATTVSEMDANRYVILFFIVITYIVLGCMMNVIPMIMLTLPALFPTVEALEFDPVWFGVLTVMLMEMGQITPPVGINVFAMSSVARTCPCSLFSGASCRSSWPWCS